MLGLLAAVADNGGMQREAHTSASDTTAGFYMPVNSVPSDTKPAHLCYLIQNEEREERDAAMHQRYLDYVSHFERWNKPKGWARYMAHHPIAALSALTKGGELPAEWCRHPMGEVDFQIEILVDSFRRMGRTD